jgi:zinc transporter ZupT
MNARDIVKNAPNSLIWAVTLSFLGVLGAFVYLSSTGSDTTDLRTFLNTALNIAAALFSGGALVVAGSAARSAGQVKDQQDNGHMVEQVREGVSRALAPQQSDPKRKPPYLR